MKRELASITAVTALAQLAAFTKLWFTARLFGVGAELDGYNLGFVLPTLVTGVLSGALQTGLFPVYARLRLDKGAEAVTHFERLVLYGVLLLAASMSLVLVLFAPWIAEILAADAPSAVRKATAFVLPLAGLAICLNGTGDYLAYILALRGRYVIAAAAPIANALLGASMLAAWPEGGLLNLTLGTVLGVAVQAGICLDAAVRLGFQPLGTLRGLRERLGETKEMLRLGGWILPGVAFANVTASLPPVLLAAYGEGAVSAFGYAYRLHQSAIQLLVMAASPAILARFSDMVVRRDVVALSRLLQKAGWLAAIIGTAAVTFVWIAGALFLQSVFGTGRFDVEAASRVAAHWGWLSLGLAPALWGNVLAKSLQADSRPKLMSMLSGVGLFALWVAASMLAPSIGQYAVPAALAISSTIVTFLAWHAVRRLLIKRRNMTGRET